MFLNIPKFSTDPKKISRYLWKSLQKIINCSSLFPLCPSQLWLVLTIGLSVVTFRSAGGAALFSSHNKKPDCQPVKRDLLRQQLGSAYNQRYMAIDDEDLYYKTNQSPLQDQDHVTKRNITKRSSTVNINQITDPTPWTCQMSKTWMNLGQGYFPRHVRAVKCSSDKCWFGHFQCRPKFYKIKVLKKKIGVCLRVSTSSGSPRWEDFWEVVEKDIAVDCECGH